MIQMDASSLVLITAFRHVINQPNIQAGFERLAALIDGTSTYDAFCDAVATCLRDGLIREPIRLPEGALQCHWHLELTPKGAAMARALPTTRSGREYPLQRWHPRIIRKFIHYYRNFVTLDELPRQRIAEPQPVT